MVVFLFHKGMRTWRVHTCELLCTTASLFKASFCKNIGEEEKTWISYSSGIIKRSEESSKNKKMAAKWLVRDAVTDIKDWHRYLTPYMFAEWGISQDDTRILFLT